MERLNASSLETQQTRPKSAALWRNRNFLILVSGQGVSLTGTQITQVTLPLLLLALTHSPAIAGLIPALGSLALLLFCLPAGALVDRWNRKKVMMICDTLSTLSLTSLVLALLFNRLTLIHIALVAFSNESLGIFFSLANSSLLPNMVEREQIPRALGANETTYSLAGTIGPALGPLLFGVGRALPFLFDALSTAASVISLIFVRTKVQPERPVASGALLTEIREGIDWLWQHKLIRFLALLTFGMIAPCSGYLLIIDLMAQQLHADTATLGLILAGGGLGSIIGSLIAGPLYRLLGLTRLIIGSVWIWGLTWLLYAFAINPLMLGLVNLVSFIIVPIYMVLQMSVRMTLIPDHLRGRINAVFRLLAFSSLPVGLALTGILLQYLDPAVTVVILFVPQLILGISLLFRIKFLRQQEQRMAA